MKKVMMCLLLAFTAFSFASSTTFSVGKSNSKRKKITKVNNNTSREEVVLTHESGYANNGVGTTGAVVFSCAARFTADELTAYYDTKKFTGIKIRLNSMDLDVLTAKIWDGNTASEPGAELYSADITAEANADDYFTHTLTSDVMIETGHEYWVGYEVSATGDHPAGCDAGPMVADKGAKILFNGAWSDLTALSASLDYNWCISAVINDGEVVGPGSPTNPTPANEATNVDIAAGTISWDNPTVGGDFYNNVYFGTDQALVEAMDASVEVFAAAAPDDHISSYDYAELTYGTTYYWKVVEAADSAATEGPVWSFTAMDEPINSIVTWDFESDLQGWTIGATPLSWQYNEGTKAIPSSGSKFIYCDSDAGGSGTTTEGDAISPVIDLSAYTGGVKIAFNYVYKIYTGSTFKLRYTLDGGTTWVDIQDIAVQEAWGQSEEITVPVEALTATTQFGFWYSGAWEYWAGVDDVMLLPPPTVVPDAVTLVAPLDAATDIAINGDLEWNESSLASGYKLFVGTDNPPTNVVNGDDLGDVLTYAYTALTTNTTYYWQVVPYNVIGDAADCPVWSFTTFANQWNGATISPLTVVETIEAGETATSAVTITAGSSDLGYKAKINFVSKSSTNNSVNTNIDITKSESHASKTPFKKSTTERTAWDLQFSYDVTTLSGGVVSQAGCESDGEFIYTTVWNSADILKFNLDGTYIETFQIAGVTGLRDLAYDGQYFYGGAAATSIYEMDFTAKTLVSTITSPTAVRSIAYDNDNDGFWCNNWDSDMICVGRDGSTIDTITGVTSCYGAAYDNLSDGGPYLWLNTGTGTNEPATLEQFSIANHATTGFTFQTATAVTAGAGGCFIQEDMISGTATIASLAQGEALYGYELCVTESWLTLTDGEGTITAGNSADVTLNFDATGFEHAKNDTTIIKTATITFDDTFGNAASDAVAVTLNIDHVGINNNLVNTNALYQNYPNPFNPSTVINFSLKNESVVSLNVYNMMGQVVASLANGSYAQGLHTVNFNASNLTSGVYYYTLKANNMNVTKKMLLVK